MDNSFSPYDRKYRACGGCCHVKTFTVVVVIIELIFLVGTLISEALSRHFRKAVCMDYEDDIQVEEMRLDSGSESTNYQLIAIEAVCSAKPVGVGWSTLQIILAILVLVGIRFSKWYLLVPHLIWQGIFLLVISFVCLILILGTTVLIFFTVQPLDFILSCFLFGVVCGLVAGGYMYVFACIFRCCQYIKREAEFVEEGRDMLQMGTISAQYATLPYSPNEYTSPEEHRPLNLKI